PAKPPVRTTDCPSGFATVTSRTPIAAVAPITSATESEGNRTPLVNGVQMCAPPAALAPAWKFVPVTVTVRFAPCSPVLGDTLEIVGMSGRAMVLVEVVRADDLTVIVSGTRLVYSDVRSEENTKHVTP